MSIKLVDRELEKKAIRFIAKGAPSSSWLLGMLTEDSFGRAEMLECFKRIRKIARTTSTIPSWDELLHDPKLSDNAKDSLALLKIKPTVNRKTAKALQIGLESYRKRRALFLGVRDAADEFEKPNFDEEKVKNKLVDTIAKAHARVNPIKTFRIGEGNNSSQLVKDILAGTSLVAIPTGFKVFDSQNRGIFMGSLMVIGANTGGGKTGMALQLSGNFADQGAKVCIISLEMKEEEVMVRNLARYSGVNLSKLINPENMSYEEKQHVTKSYVKRVKELKAKGATEAIEVPQEDMTLEELFFVIKPFGYDVIIVDYISLLKDAAGDEQWRRLGDVARYAKVFARSNNCIVVLLAQVSPEGMIRYSRAVEEHANNAWYWVRDAKSFESHVLHVSQKKARNQRMFDFDLLENFAIMTVTDLDEATAKKLAAEAANGNEGHNNGPKSKYSKGSSGGNKGSQKLGVTKRKTVQDEDEYFSQSGGGL